MSQSGIASSTPPPLPSDPSSSEAKPQIPWAFIDCSADTLVILISHMLNLLIEHNDQVVLTPDALTRFHSRAAPGISVIEYLRRIVKYTNMEKIPLLSLLAYIDLTCAHLPTFTLSTLTVHRFLIAGVCAGSKAQCDVFCTNSHYAKVGGIKVQELNALEREFLRVTQWNLCCNADLLQRYYTSLIKSHGGFTQAPPPAVTPFRAFPRSVSKPRTPEEDGEDPMDAEEAEDDDMGGEGEGMEDDETAGSGGEEASRRRRKSVDHLLGISAEGGEGQVYERGRGRRRNGSPTMDVEPAEQHTAHTPQRQPQCHSPSDPATTSTLNATPTSSHSTLSPQKSRDAPISPASSSIPSSSRSSIRMGGSGRAPSLTNLAGGGRPAEAVLDRRHAGMKGTSTPDVLGGQVFGASVPEGASLGRGSLSEESNPSGHRYDEPDIYEEEAEGDAGRTSNGGTGPGHGRLLKNIVGVFRKRSSVPPPPHHVSDTSTSSQPGHRPHSVLPSRPLSTAPSHHTSADLPAPSKLMSPIPRHPASEVRPLPGSPRDTTMAQQIKSPGMPTSVTPRIRTRDERSVESLRDRNGVGVGIGMD